MSKSTQGVTTVTQGGENTFPAAAFGGVQVVKNAPGILCSVLVTTSLSAIVTIFDNASAGSGTVIGYIPATAVAGNIFVFNMPANLGITIGALANTGAVTVSYI